MQSLPIYARLLCQQVGLKFTMGGKTAWSAGGHINLPALPYNQPEVNRLAFGMIMHEAGHEAYTDYQVFDTIKQDRAMKNMVNRLEDIRIEKCQIERIPGAKRRLQEMVEGLSSLGYFKEPDDQDSASSLLGKAILYGLRAEILSQESVGKWGTQALERLSRMVPGHLVNHLMDTARKVVFCQNTQQVKDLAANILDLIKQYKQQAQQQAASQQAQNGNDQDQQQQGQDQQEVSNQDGQQQDQSSSVQDGSAASSSGSQAQAGNGGEQEKLKKQIRDLSNIMNGKNDAAPGDIGKMICEALTEITYNKSDATITLPTAKESLLEIGETEAILERVRKASRALQTRIHRSFEATAKKKRVYSEEGRRVDVSRLWRTKAGDYRVFVEKTEALRINTAVQILVDCSGSMVLHDRMQTTIDASIAMAIALSKLNGVKVATATFPAVGAFLDNENEIISVIHTFHQRPERFAKRFMAITSSAYTPTAEALLWAGNELVKRNESRKIIFLMTDGIPERASTSKKVYAGLTKEIRISLEQEGIEVIGIGINIDVSEIFPRSVVVKNLEDLSSSVFSVMSDALFKQAA